MPAPSKAAAKRAGSRRSRCNARNSRVAQRRVRRAAVARVPVPAVAVVPVRVAVVAGGVVAVAVVDADGDAERMPMNNQQHHSFSRAACFVRLLLLAGIAAFALPAWAQK